MYAAGISVLASSSAARARMRAKWNIVRLQELLRHVGAAGDIHAQAAQRILVHHAHQPAADSPLLAAGKLQDIRRPSSCPFRRSSPSVASWSK